MADKKIASTDNSGEEVIARAKDFWSRNNKAIMTIAAVIIIVGGGWVIYNNFIKGPKEKKAAEMMFKAEEYYRMDSVNLALNGDGQNAGFLRVISKYGGTKAGELAHYYAGVCYIRLNDNANAVKHLKKVDVSSKPVQQRAYKLLGDAYADLGQNNDAFASYKKAAHHFEEDKLTSAEALFAAAYFAHRKLNNPKEAIELYKELKQKYPQTKEGLESDNYLAQLGVYNVN